MFNPGAHIENSHICISNITWPGAIVYSQFQVLVNLLHHNQNFEVESVDKVYNNIVGQRVFDISLMSNTLIVLYNH